MLRGGVDPLRQHELDLAREVVQAEHETELALAPAAPNLLGERGERARIVEIDLHAGMAGLGSLVERDEALHAHLDGLAIGLGLDIEQHRGTRLEQSARGRQQF